MTHKVRIGMVLDAPYPGNPRVAREARALVEAGYEVHLLCRMGDEDQPAEDIRDGLLIHRVIPAEVDFLLPFINVRTRFPYRGLFKNLNKTLWNVDTVWHTLIRRFVYRYGIDILHIHELRLVSTGLAVATRYNRPLVADLHRHYPAHCEQAALVHGEKKPEKVRRLWERFEKIAAWEADRVIVTSPEERDRLMRKSIRPQKMTVLPDAVDMDYYESLETDSEIIRHYKTNFLLTYCGRLDRRDCGLHIALEALHELKDEIPELHLAAVGDTDPDLMKNLRLLVAHYGLEQRVTFISAADDVTRLSYIEASDVGLHIPLSNDETNSQVPESVFLYHLLGKPVVASTCVPLVRYLEESNGGLWFESGNSKELVEHIRRLYDERHLRKTLGRQGQRTVREKYNWQARRGQLLSLYQELIESHEYEIRHNPARQHQ